MISPCPPYYSSALCCLLPLHHVLLFRLVASDCLSCSAKLGRSVLSSLLFPLSLSPCRSHPVFIFCLAILLAFCLLFSAMRQILSDSEKLGCGCHTRAPKPILITAILSCRYMVCMKNHEKSGWVHLIWNQGQVLTAGCGETQERARTFISDQSKEVSRDRERRRNSIAAYKPQLTPPAGTEAPPAGTEGFSSKLFNLASSSLGRFRRVNGRWKPWNLSKATAPFLFPCSQGNKR